MHVSHTKRDGIGSTLALLHLKSERVPIKRRTSSQVFDEQLSRHDVVKHYCHPFLLRPTNARHWYLGSENLARAFRFRPPTGGRILRRHQKQDAWSKRAVWKVEAEVDNVGVAPTVHHHVAPGGVRQVPQIGMSHQPPVLLPAQEQSVAHGDDEQASIRQEAQTHGSARDAGNDFLLAREIDGPNLLGTEVGEPEATIVPTR